MNRQDDDGRPFFSYFTEECAFCWAGDFREQVEVARGGAGEPITARFSIDPQIPGEPLSPLVWLAWFETQCNSWLMVQESLDG